LADGGVRDRRKAAGARTTHSKLSRISETFDKSRKGD
jgi:hypothetical protein